MNRMFPFITKTWNPLGGECLHHCSYCWAQKLAKEKRMRKYQGEPKLTESLVKWFKSDDFVFVCDMLDLFGPWVSTEDIGLVLGRIVESPAKFLFLTKNPARYTEFLSTLQKINGVLGVTLETNRETEQVSKALNPAERWLDFKDLEYSPKFVAIEPIMDFDLESFSDELFNITNLESVAIGYDNYGNRLSEPPLEKTMQLIDRLEKAGITVYRKTLRERWNAVERGCSS